MQTNDNAAIETFDHPWMGSLLRRWFGLDASDVERTIAGRLNDVTGRIIREGALPIDHDAMTDDDQSVSGDTEIVGRDDDIPSLIEWTEDMDDEDYDCE